MTTSTYYNQTLTIDEHTHTVVLTPISLEEYNTQVSNNNGQVSGTTITNGNVITITTPTHIVG